jgi:hypothetical protein
MGLDCTPLLLLQPLLLQPLLLPFRNPHFERPRLLQRGQIPHTFRTPPYATLFKLDGPAR